MQAFHLERRMMSMLGGFYPTGHLFVMVPTEAHAQRAEEMLAQGGVDVAQVRMLTPGDIEDVAHLFDRHDLLLPSVGSDEDTARHFAELARDGHHALLVPVRNAQACQQAVKALHDAQVSCAVHYRHFVIEDLTV